MANITVKRKEVSGYDYLDFLLKPRMVAVDGKELGEIVDVQYQGYRFEGMPRYQYHETLEEAVNALLVKNGYEPNYKA